MTQQMEREAVDEPVAPPAEGARAEAEDGVSPPLHGAQGGADRLGRIRVRASVELGSAQLLVRDVAKLRPGSVVPLDRLVGEPADLVVNGMLLARGSVVVVDDHLGLRITEVCSTEAE